MAVAGWKRRDMLDRYTQAAAAERAATEARQLNLGDLDYCSPPWPGCWLEPRSRGVEAAIQCKAGRACEGRCRFVVGSLGAS